MSVFFSLLLVFLVEGDWWCWRGVLGLGYGLDRQASVYVKEWTRVVGREKAWELYVCMYNHAVFHG